MCNCCQYWHTILYTHWRVALSSPLRNCIHLYDLVERQRSHELTSCDVTCVKTNDAHYTGARRLHRPSRVLWGKFDWLFSRSFGFIFDFRWLTFTQIFRMVSFDGVFSIVTTLLNQFWTIQYFVVADVCVCVCFAPIQFVSPSQHPAAVRTCWTLNEGEWGDGQALSWTGGERGGLQACVKNGFIWLPLRPLMTVRAMFVLTWKCPHKKRYALTRFI